MSSKHREYEKHPPIVQVLSALHVAQFGMQAEKRVLVFDCMPCKKSKFYLLVGYYMSCICNLSCAY